MSAADIIAHSGLGWFFDDLYQAIPDPGGQRAFLIINITQEQAVILYPDLEDLEEVDYREATTRYFSKADCYLENLDAIA